MKTILLKVLSRNLWQFFLLWNEAGRPFKEFKVISAQDPQFVGVRIFANDYYRAVEWITDNIKKIGFSIVEENER